MSVIRNHSIELTTDGYIAYLFIEEPMLEMGSELGKQLEDKPEELEEIEGQARRYVLERLPNLKVNMVKVLLGTILITAFPLMAETSVASAQQSQTYVVVPGDSLFLIAKRFGMTVDELKRINQLTGDMIFVGQTLRLTAPAEQPSMTRYTVVAGDSLFLIGRRFGVTVDQLRQANKLTSDTLMIGQVLMIPIAQTAPTPPVALTIGSTGGAVENLQRQLQTLGYFKHPTITGYFGEITAQSVRDFQRAYQLSVTGVADQNTVNEIQKAVVKRQLVRDTFSYTGVPYLWGGSTPAGFDCSGFVHYMFNKHGVQMTRTTSEMLYRMGQPISHGQLQPGDLVFYAVNEPGVISHVGFYAGNNQFISATSSRGIWSYDLNNSYWSKYYMGAKRIY
ncbi:C40 family peptidase [Caldalkalibacillus mannanilyticus]|uniref:C40 family peptidase n=1 Tax=Caldalkalibacillus mannanilyticus TaxID=1418 RepID=UPI0004686352|nr:C40 family peptidase [Caldalkalibacillus mannanilyticus]